MKKLLSVLLVLFFLTGCEGGNVGNTDYQVRAAYVPAGFYLPFLIVEHDGLLEKRGYELKLKRFNDNSQMISSFLNGNLDVTAQSALTMFPVEQKHPGMFKFVYAQYNHSYFFVVGKDSNIKGIKDLKGKTIGIWKSPTADAYVQLLMSVNNLSKNDYKTKRFSATDLAPSIENGAVDVIFGFDVPIGKLVESGKFRYLEEDAISKLLPNVEIFNGGAFINTRLIANNMKKSVAIRDSLLEAIEIIRKDKGRADKILSKKLNIPIDIVSKSRLDSFVWPTSEAIQSANRTYQMLLDESVVNEDNGVVPVSALFWKQRD